MAKTLSAAAEGSAFISKGQVSLLDEIRTMCFFTDRKAQKRFIKKVSSVSGACKFSDIKKEDFGSAYLTAESILQKRGESVFRKQNNNFQELQSDDSEESEGAA